MVELLIMLLKRYWKSVLYTIVLVIVLVYIKYLNTKIDTLQKEVILVKYSTIKDEFEEQYATKPTIQRRDYEEVNATIGKHTITLP